MIGAVAAGANAILPMSPVMAAAGAAWLVSAATGVSAFLPHAAVKAARLRAIVSRACFMVFSRSEEHTSELQSLMRISYAVFCLKKKKTQKKSKTNDNNTSNKTQNKTIHTHKLIQHNYITNYHT